ncbi:hypothetical protein SDC9_175651 [bioreactor metagenome]|uniref:Uncharacterized protein n=1 Tax=bioreactor metagenome TaxID=1076179 RepID=A0A645GPR5_9ZZZZ
MPTAEFSQNRGLLVANFFCIRAAGRKDTAFGRRQRVGDFALQNDALSRAVHLRVKRGNCRKQRARIGMHRAHMQFSCLRELNDFAEIHDPDALRNMLHNRQIVRNKEIGQPHILLQLFQHIDDLRLNGHVQRGYRFVANDELRLHRERAGNTDALPLSAGKLVRIARGLFVV